MGGELEHTVTELLPWPSAGLRVTNSKNDDDERNSMKSEHSSIYRALHAGLRA